MQIRKFPDDVYPVLLSGTGYDSAALSNWRPIHNELRELSGLLALKHYGLAAEELTESSRRNLVEHLIDKGIASNWRSGMEEVRQYERIIQRNIEHYYGAPVERRSQALSELLNSTGHGRENLMLPKSLYDEAIQLAKRHAQEHLDIDAGHEPNMSLFNVRRKLIDSYVETGVAQGYRSAEVKFGQLEAAILRNLNQTIARGSRSL